MLAGATPVLVHNCPLSDATDLDLSATALAPTPIKGNKAFNPKYNATEAGRATQKHTDPIKRSADHVAKYEPYLQGADRIKDKEALNVAGRDILADVLGNPANTRTISAASAHYGGSVLEIMNTTTGVGGRWSLRDGGALTFEGWL